MLYRPAVSPDNNCLSEILYYLPGTAVLQRWHALNFKNPVRVSTLVLLFLRKPSHNFTDNCQVFIHWRRKVKRCDFSTNNMYDWHSPVHKFSNTHGDENNFLNFLQSHWNFGPLARPIEQKQNRLLIPQLEEEGLCWPEEYNTVRKIKRCSSDFLLFARCCRSKIFIGWAKLYIYTNGRDLSPLYFLW